MDKKIAVYFPGLGYHHDKPLLIYSRKLLESLGYERIKIEYRDLPWVSKENPFSDINQIIEADDEQNISLLVYKGTNHSLETGDQKQMVREQDGMLILGEIVKSSMCPKKKMLFAYSWIVLIIYTITSMRILPLVLWIFWKMRGRKYVRRLF